MGCFEVFRPQAGKIVVPLIVCENTMKFGLLKSYSLLPAYAGILQSTTDSPYLDKPCPYYRPRLRVPA